MSETAVDFFTSHSILVNIAPVASLTNLGASRSVRSQYDERAPASATCAPDRAGAQGHHDPPADHTQQVSKPTKNDNRSRFEAALPPQLEGHVTCRLWLPQPITRGMKTR